MSSASFSAATRRRRWMEVEREPYDLAVVGGGITGVGIARDAAGRGLSVVLFEAGDIAEGTSSLSSRLVHGGLRYLETFDFALVFEALRERRRLLELAPHLVRPLPFLFPVYRGDPTGLTKLMAGMWLYEALSMLRSPRRHRMFRRRGAIGHEPALRSSELKGGALYYDAQVDDARLTLAIGRAAHETGADIFTRARVTSVDARSTVDEFAVVGVADQVENRAYRIRARVVVNAAGPWSDRVRAFAEPSTRPRLRTTKGAHIMVPRHRVGNRGAVIFRSCVDGRVMFVLPWGDDFTYVGTTDTEFAGDPSTAAADEADLGYLLDSANGIFPSSRLTRADVISTWAGVRPLLAPAEERGLSASATSREHAIWRDPSGLLNVAGGKLTTFRSMAAEVVDRAAAILRDEFGRETGDCHTEYLAVPGAPDPGALPASDAGSRSEAEDHLDHRYGTDAALVRQLIIQDPSLGTPIVAGRPDLRAEAVYAVRHEMALTLEDVLRRRLHLCYELRDGALSAAPEVAALIAGMPELDWNTEEIERQLVSYSDAVRATRPAPR